MIKIGDQEWVTAAEARAQVGEDVTAEMLRDWKRRGIVDAVRQGRHNLYRLDTVIDAEVHTRRARKRPRRAGLTAP